MERYPIYGKSFKGYSAFQGGQIVIIKNGFSSYTRLSIEIKDEKNV